jgi:hypothetical protein
VAQRRGSPAVRVGGHGLAGVGGHSYCGEGHRGHTVALAQPWPPRHQVRPTPAVWRCRHRHHRTRGRRPQAHPCRH